MQKLISKILVPVDFSSRSKRAVAQAIKFARIYDCTVWLLYVVKRNDLIPLPAGFKGKLKLQLEASYDCLQNKEKPFVRLAIEAAQGSHNEVVIDFVHSHAIDLVVINRERGLFAGKKAWLNPGRISEKTSVPVMAVSPDRDMAHLHSIIIPVTDFLPVRKLMYGIYLSAGPLSTIKLLGVSNTHTKRMVMHYMVKASSLIREHCIAKVEMENIESENIAGAIESYARSKAADLVILNPGIQSGVRNFFTGLFSRVLQKNAPPPVLTLNPI
jgi:nucleotide-binding universal stress UspA family protein